MCLRPVRWAAWCGICFSQQSAFSRRRLRAMPELRTPGRRSGCILRLSGCSPSERAGYAVNLILKKGTSGTNIVKQ